MDEPTIPFALVVDDDPVILMYARDILEEVGFRLLEARSGDEALEVLEIRAAEIIVLFSDVVMPGRTDGFALAQYVAERWPHIEIVIASGQVKPASDVMPDHATFVAKPFNHATVFNHFRSVLSGADKRQNPG